MCPISKGKLDSLGMLPTDTKYQDFCLCADLITGLEFLRNLRFGTARAYWCFHHPTSKFWLVLLTT